MVEMGADLMTEQYPYQSVYERYGFKCAYCGIDGSGDFQIWFNANFAVDHIKPRKFGGTDHPDNLALACHSCNLYKGAIDCDSIDKAKEVIRQKKRQAQNWYERFVLKRATTADALAGGAGCPTSRF
jgi:5-methylcytosine-specific restriction endonuclease McrA